MDNHLKTGGEILEFKDEATGSHNINPECATVFSALKIRRRHKFIIYKIGEVDIHLDYASERNATFSDFSKALPYTECRYCVYDHEYKSPDGRDQSKLWFICWFPKNSTPHNKMTYAYAKARFHEIIPGTYDRQVTCTEQLQEVIQGNGDEDIESDGDDEDF
eukprot:gene2134-4164_t